MKTYAIIKPDEDGNCFTQVNINHLLEDPRGEYGIKEFVTLADADRAGGVQYLGEYQAVLISFEEVMPQAVTKSWELP